MDKSYSVTSQDGKHLTQAYEDCGVFYWHLPLRDGTVEHRPIRPDACREYKIDALPYYSKSRQQDALEAFDAEWIAEYKRNAPKRASREQRAEMRAAFGPGKVIVNVITGRKTRT